MTNTENSINQNGCSVCATGTENYTTFRPVHHTNTLFYQYDYRHTNGNLFSTVASTLEECREKRDKWLQKKRFNKLFPATLKQIQEEKRLTKSDMGFQIGHIDPYHVASIYWDTLKRGELVEMFNKMFGTEIK
ncbi:hypothetical protein FACS189413_04070 [Bacteroidia bacterium]|nr:hypothetical protein FACS189413_04070 [Bacteroidia bacterium]